MNGYFENINGNKYYNLVPTKTEDKIKNVRRTVD